MFGKKNIKMSIVIIATLLFFLLSPGVIVTLPATHNATDTVENTCGTFFQLAHGKNDCATNWTAVFLHSLLFGLLVYLFIEATMGKIKGNIFKF